jgi:hypothetical protein
MLKIKQYVRNKIWIEIIKSTTRSVFLARGGGDDVTWAGIKQLE